MTVACWLRGSLFWTIVALGAAARAEEPYIIVASTTSTDQSGIFPYLLPRFKAATGIEARVVALGTGQALDLARRGDADVVFVHDPAAEEEFVAQGWGLARNRVMYNDFVLIGPRDDPARVRGLRVQVALARIAARQAAFVSRGDRSGTYEAELRLWHAAGVDLLRARGPWYRETGSGMGPALNTASALGAYILADRSTWLNFHNRADLEILVAGDAELFNQYGVIVVNPARHPGAKPELAQQFADWLVSEPGQAAIAGYRIAGQQVFFPNAAKSD